jgi:hypothetical protein
MAERFTVTSSDGVAISVQKAARGLRRMAECLEDSHNGAARN